MRQSTVSGTILAMLGAGALGLMAAPAHATFHEWKMVELYSNSTGTVQFIELQESPALTDNESFVGGKTITDSALGHTFTFATNTPSIPVNNQDILIGTPGYAALAGVPAPDYTLPVNDFFSTTGDTLSYVGGIDTWTYGSGVLPTDGVNSLNRPYGSPVTSVSINTPTNFAGQNGTVPEPATLGLLAGGSCFALLRRRARPQS